MTFLFLFVSADGDAPRAVLGAKGSAATGKDLGLMIIWVSGPTGSGKTTLVQQMVNAGWAAVREDVPVTLFQKFSDDPASACGDLQKAIMSSRAQQWRGQPPGSMVFDRSIDEDLEIFCQLHSENGYLPETEFRQLRDMHRELKRSMPQPDLILYLTADIAVLDARLRQLNHPCAIIKTLRRQYELYEQWVDRRAEDILRLDTGRCSASVLQHLLNGAWPQPRRHAVQLLR